MEEPSLPLTGRAESGTAVARIGKATYHTEIALPEGHSLTADLPAFAGGQNDGPAAIDLLLASFAAGKAALIRMQADRHGWPMTGAVISARHHRENARSLGEGRRGIVDVIDCEIEILGDELTDQQRRRLAEMSNHCWVQHALRHETLINTRLVT
ncbi:MAG: OsmC family protein [Phycisphaerales bacterium]|nr:MAG: OsmC family protein [Phycisphaerales bacterium]